MPAQKKPSRRRLLFALAAVGLATCLAFGALLAVDVYLHGKFERSAGFNIWGYRGPIAEPKRDGEFRVVLVGGSAAYGYGVNWDEAIPAVLERKLNPTKRSIAPFSVINLGYNNEGAYSFKFTLNDYLSLDYDLACLYEGYNDMIGDPQRPNLSIFRHESPVFRLTGYLPIFPIVFKEKAAVMLNGDAGALYHPEQKTVFRPGLAAQTAAEVLNIAAEVGQSLERQLDRVVAQPRRKILDAASTGCKYPWQEYCRSILVAVEFALQRGKQVLVATQPYAFGSLRARHMEQQGEMAAMLKRKFGGNAHVRYVDLGDTVDLANPDLSFDRMHLTAIGNDRVAAAFVEPVLEMAAQRAESRAGSRAAR